MSFIPAGTRRHLRRILAVSGLALGAAFSLAACGEVVQNANLGRCTAMPQAGGMLCEEIGGEYIFVDSLTRTMRRYSAAQAQLIAGGNTYMASAQAANASGGYGGQRNCLANPSIACSGALNNRVTGYRSGGTSGVCSGGQCLSMAR